MLLKPIAIAAGLAGAAQAFLVPPEVPDSSVKVASAISAIPNIATASVFDLPCPGCPVHFKGKHGEVHVKTDKPNHLALSFSIDHSTGSDRLLVNNFELYPKSDPFHSSLVVPQVVDRRHRKHREHKDGNKDVNKEEINHKKHHKHIEQSELGFTLSVHPFLTSEEDHVDIIPLDLQIIEVGNTFVNGIPNVHIKLLRLPSGELMIGNLEMTASQTTSSMSQQGECTTAICRWFAIIQDKLKNAKGFKNCHGNKQDGENGEMRPGHKHHGDRPDMSGEHRHGNGHAQTYYHSWGQLFKNIASHIMLPVLVGIIAGISVSLIGMVFGTLIVSVFRFLFRRNYTRPTGHMHHKEAQKEDAVAEEKSGLIEHQDPPPYEDEEEEQQQKPVSI